MSGAKRYLSLNLDMDGVIIDSEGLAQDTERVIFKKFGLEVPAEYWSQLKGLNSRDIMRQAVARYGEGLRLDPDVLVRERRELFLERAPQEVTMMPGAHNLLVQASTLVKKISLTTSSSRVSQELMFKMFDLGRFFNVVVTADDILQGMGKPNKEPYRLTFQKLQMRSTDGLVVEDSGHGVMSGRSNGSDVVGFTSTTTADVLFSHGAMMVVNSLEKIIPLLE